MADQGTRVGSTTRRILPATNQVTSTAAIEVAAAANASMLARAVTPNVRVNHKTALGGSENAVHNRRQVARDLAGLGLVETVRGRTGGLRLRRSARRRKLDTIVRQLEPVVLAECFGPDPEACVLTGSRRLAGVLRQAGDAFFAALDRHTIADLVARPTSYVDSSPDDPAGCRSVCRCAVASTQHVTHAIDWLVHRAAGQTR